MQIVQSSQHSRQGAVHGCLAIAGLLLVGNASLVAAEPIDRTIVSRVPAKVHRYVERLMQRRDLNDDGELSKDEWRVMSGDPKQVDLNGDTIVTSDELLLHVGRYGLARMPVRLLSPREELPTNPAVTLQSPTLEGDQNPDAVEQEASPSSAADGDQVP